MTEPYTPSKAAQEAKEILTSSSSITEKVQTLKALAHYESGGYPIHQALLEGLKDSHPAVRAAAYASLGWMHLDKWELPEIAREIRHALELEQAGSPAFYAGVKALDRLRDYYESNFMYLDERYCPLWVAANSPF